ncbi:MAG TPA: hypothetical protein P5560_13180 [Thermotogota bacterium]|nr:hypothetical protein [Thermotogota bacterium]
MITEIGPVSLTQRALDGFSVLDSSLQVNEEGSILIRGKNITNLSAFEFWLTYDSTKFEFVSELGGSKVEFLGPIVAFLKIVSEPDANTLVISGASENGAVQLVDEDIIQINIRAKTSEGKSPLLFGEQSTALDASGNPMDVSFHSGFLSIGDQSLPFLLGDFDQNEQVELNDLTLFSNKYLTQMGDVDFNGIYDIGPAQNTFSNGWEQIIDTPFPDGQVDVQDFFVLGQNYLRTKPSDNPLVAPTTPVPADGASGVEQGLTLSWTHDNSAGGITYDVYLGTSATPPLIQEGLTAKEYQASGLESGVTYYWKVVAKDAEGEAGSETWSFQTAVEIPFSEEGLQLWLAADKIEGLADGAAVGTWNDLSGNGRNAVQGSATLKPVYKTGVINGKPAIRFSGGRYLDTTLIPAVGAGARTLIAVIKNGVKASGSSAEMILHYGEDQTGKAYGLAFKKLGTNKIGTDHWNNGLESGMDCTTESLILQSVYTGTQDIMYINGEESGRGTFALNTGNESPLRVGKIITIPNFYYTGDIAEVIVYGRAITDSERREIEAYLAGKYGIEVSGGGAGVAAPTVPVPADGASGVEQVPTLSWTHDNSAGGITYDVYLGTSATPPLIQEGLTAKEYQASGLESGVTYYWKVVAKDAEGEAGSETWSFQTAVEIPFSEEGLQLWLAADKIEGLADGAAVGTWNDLSGNGRNAVQGSATLKPVYKTGVINGKPAIRFSGGRYLDTTLIPAVGAGARTLIAVIKNGVKASGSSAEMILHYGEDQTGKAYGLAFKKLGTNKIGTDHWNNGLESGMDCTTESLILQSVYTGTQDIMYINGEESGRGTFALNTGNESPLRVGKIITIPNFYYTGDIAEVIVYGRAITDSERREIEAYLAGKYGIEVESSTDPALKMPDLTVGRSSPFTLGITAKNLQQVSGFTIELNFDPTRIGIDTSVGSLDGLVQFLAPFSGGLKIVQQPDAGTLLINCALMSPEGVDVTSAEIVQVKLQGEGITGTSQVMFGDDTLILDESSNPIVTDISDAGNVTLN